MKDKDILMLSNSGYEIEFSELMNKNQVVRVERKLIFHPDQRYRVCFLGGISDDDIFNAYLLAAMNFDHDLKEMFKKYDTMFGDKRMYRERSVHEIFDECMEDDGNDFSFKTRLKSTHWELTEQREDIGGCNDLFDETINYVINKLKTIIN